MEDLRIYGSFKNGKSWVKPDTLYHWISGIHEMTWVDVRTEGVETINTSQDGIQHWIGAVDHEPE